MLLTAEHLSKVKLSYFLDASVSLSQVSQTYWCDKDGLCLKLFSLPPPIGTYLSIESLHNFCIYVLPRLPGKTPVFVSDRNAREMCNIALMER